MLENKGRDAHQDHEVAPCGSAFAFDAGASGVPSAVDSGEQDVVNRGMLGQKWSSRGEGLQE